MQNHGPGSNPPASIPLPNLCYGIAYFILPPWTFKNYNELIRKFTETPPWAGPALYLMACQANGMAPNTNDARRLKSHTGRLDEVNQFYIVEYPEPPPFGHAQEEILKGKQGLVLAPYFSAVVRHRETNATYYFTLGQAPIAGVTTFRRVTPEGMNCNLGVGPAPRLAEFLNHLRNINWSKFPPA